jgi:putative tricarboxylic transport membrane protein
MEGYVSALTLTRRSMIASGLACGAAHFGAGLAFAVDEEWKPTRHVETVVGVAPGGSMDRTARSVDEALRKAGVIPASSVVLNKPGGGHMVALAYTAGRRADANVIQVINTPLLTNKMLGRGRQTYTDVTPLANLFLEEQMFAVSKNSSIKDAADVMKRLKADPGSISYGVSSGLGTTNGMAALLLAQSLGIDPKKLKPVSFNSASEAVTTTLGGHIDLVITTPFSLVPFFQSGDLRPIAVASKNRLGGILKDVPTWRELGAEVVTPGFRVVVGPPGLKSNQIAFWENAFRTITKTPAWQDQLKSEFLTPQTMGSADTVAFLKDEYDRYASVYRSMGLI